MNCPEPALIAELVHGQAPSIDAAALEDHLADCSHCIEVVAAAVTSSWASQGASSPGASEASSAPGAPEEAGGGAGATRPLTYGGMAIIPPGTRLGRYRVRRWLGRGGMGEVYEGYDPELDRRVALKLLRTRSDDDAVAQRRLGREAKTLARLSSPNVVAALDVGVFGGQLFLVMELVEGPTLAAWLLLKPRGWRELLEMFLAAGEGLAAAHEVGVIHRDFKPQNVLIGADGKPRVSDFGLAREGDDLSSPEEVPSRIIDSSTAPLQASSGSRQATPDATAETLVESAGRAGAGTAERPTGRSALTRTGTVIGTPRYMAPEQFLRRPLDARVDQFAFCVALYEALYGAHPFTRQPSSSGRLGTDGGNRKEGVSPVETLDTLRTAVLAGRSMPVPRDVRAPRAIGEALRRGLARHPDDRYPTLRGLLSALRQSSTNRRRPWRLAAAGILLVLLAGVGALTWRSLRKPENEVIEAGGEPADWSSARVLARVSETIHCIQRIDDKTLRMIWGKPHRAEDIDIATGARRSTGLVPESYRHGCPSISPDRRQLLFEGYDQDGRPHIFRSQHLDGHDARPIVSSAEPSLASEPVWLSSGQGFVFDLDLFHPAVFSVTANGFSVVPDKDRLGHQGMGFYKSASSSSERIVVVESQGNRDTRVEVYRWPALQIDDVFLFKGLMDGPWRFSPGGDSLVGVIRHPEQAELAELDLGSRRFSRKLRIRDRSVAAFSFIGDRRIAIATQRLTSTVVYRNATGIERELLREEHATYSSPTVLGTGEVLVIRQKGGAWNVVLADPAGGTSRDLTPGPDDFAVTALPGGEWLLARALASDEGGPTVFRCSGALSDKNAGCRPILAEYVYQLAASPDGGAVAYVVTTGGGLVVRLMSPNGDDRRDVTNNATVCPLIWAGARRLWISRRSGADIAWTEFAGDELKPTGRTVPSDTNCLDQLPDPRAPAETAVRVAVRAECDIRVGAFP